MYEKITLPNGVRIIFERIPYVRSVSFGIWIGTGSRFELSSENGSSHFIEHMLFKGTSHRSAAQIAKDCDAIGGQVNAFTTKECTCFYGHVLDSHLSRLTDILCDMLFFSSFREEDVQNERSVIYEEIDMYEDTPDDLVTEQLFTSVFRGNALSRPVLGTKKTLADLTGERLKAYMQDNYRGDAIVAAISGSYSDKDLKQISEQLLAAIPGPRKNPRAATYHPSFVLRNKDIEQNHLCLAFPGIQTDSAERFCWQLFSSIFGSGASSRLFQKVREERGLCYTIYTFGSAQAKEGLFGIYTALNKDTEEKALELILSELDRLKNDGVTQEELNLVREQAKANVLMSLESTVARMNRLGRSELLQGIILSTEELIAGYDAVTKDQIQKLAQNYFDMRALSFSAVGQTGPEEYYRRILRL